MANILIAKRYAKAAFDLALEMNVIEEVKSDMELMLSVCSTNKDFVQLLRSPVIKSDKKIKVLDVLFKNDMNELSLRFFNIIARKKREQFIGIIAEEFINIYKKFKNIITVQFQGAHAISDDLRKKVIALMEEQTKATIEFNEEIKGELIGGFVLSYDDFKYDASIAHQLRRLKKAAAEVNLYTRGI